MFPMTARQEIHAARQELSDAYQTIAAQRLAGEISADDARGMRACALENCLAKLDSMYRSEQGQDW